MSNLTREDVIRVGAELRRLMASGTFNTCVELLRQDYQNRIVQTSSGEEAERERLYRQYHSLNDLVGVMVTFVHEAEQEFMTADEDDEE